ncbi:hypothetical protein AM587_10006052 [Phytophthora nicotianae]|uniref:Uncharacterized protein n=2 Tax=Phytophthora nicotianae TaxID=4792 RepID=A0A0W8BV59_PHYNI|nr:hypothetical protein AM587_10006052 [Phytophthora nicotianae]
MNNPFSSGQELPVLLEFRLDRQVNWRQKRRAAGIVESSKFKSTQGVLAILPTLSLVAVRHHSHFTELAVMAPKTALTFEFFMEHDQIPENLSILIYTEEEEVEDYFDAEWDEDTAPDSPVFSGKTSIEAIYSSCATTDSSSVLGGCVAPTTPAKATTPHQMSSTPVVFTGETRASFHDAFISS